MGSNTTTLLIIVAILAIVGLGIYFVLYNKSSTVVSGDLVGKDEFIGVTDGLGNVIMVAGASSEPIKAIEGTYTVNGGDPAKMEGKFSSEKEANFWAVVAPATKDVKLPLLKSGDYLCVTIKMQAVSGKMQTIESCVEIGSVTSDKDMHYILGNKDLLQGLIDMVKGK